MCALCVWAGHSGEALLCNGLAPSRLFGMQASVVPWECRRALCPAPPPRPFLAATSPSSVPFFSPRPCTVVFWICGAQQGIGVSLRTSGSYWEAWGRVGGVGGGGRRGLLCPMIPHSAMI